MQSTSHVLGLLPGYLFNADKLTMVYLSISPFFPSLFLVSKGFALMCIEDSGERRIPHLSLFAGLRSTVNVPAKATCPHTASSLPCGLWTLRVWEALSYHGSYTSRRGGRFIALNVKRMIGPGADAVGHKVHGMLSGSTAKCIRAQACDFVCFHRWADRKSDWLLALPLRCPARPMTFLQAPARAKTQFPKEMHPFRRPVTFGPTRRRY